jgi:hypothetical protein
MPPFCFEHTLQTALPPAQHCTRMDWDKHASEQCKGSIIYIKIKTQYAHILASLQSSFSKHQCSCTINMLHVHYSKLSPCCTGSPNISPFLLHCHCRFSEWLVFVSLCTHVFSSFCLLLYTPRKFKILNKVLSLYNWLSHISNSFLHSYSAVQVECLCS